MKIELMHPSYKVIPFETYESMVKRVEQAGRTCYQSESRGNPEEFIKKLIKSGHHSVIEHAQLTVIFNIDRGVSHELVRHRLSSFSQMSTRYVDHSTYCPFIIPSWLDIAPGIYEFTRNAVCYCYVEGLPTVFVHDDPNVNSFITALCFAADSYSYLRAHNWSPQQARAILPSALKTEIVMTSNIREWRHVIQLRSRQNCHPDMYSIMRELKAELVTDYPAFFGDLATVML